MLDKNRYVGTVSKTEEFNVTAQIVDNILCTAFEGSIHYWVDHIEVHCDEDYRYGFEAIALGGYIDIFPFEDDASYRLNLSKFLRGFKMAADHYKLSFSDFYENHDAEYADLVVQFALFDSIVYG